MIDACDDFFKVEQAIVSGLNFSVSYALLSLYSIIKGKGVINPIW